MYDFLWNSVEIAFVALVAVGLHGLVRPAKYRAVIWGAVGIRALLPFKVADRICIVGIFLRSSEKAGYAQNGMTGSWITAVWVIGMIVFVFGVGFEYLRLWKLTRCVCEQTEGIYVANGIPSAFTVGWLRPRIYMPSDADAEVLPFLIEHEKAHIVRQDFLLRQIALIILCINWYNPILWLAYYAFSSDQELACDEEVILAYDSKQRAAYAKALVLYSSPVAAVSLQFGARNVKRRIKNVLFFRNWNKYDYILTTVIVIIIAILLTIGIRSTGRREQANDRGQEQTSDMIPGTDADTNVDFFMPTDGEEDSAELKIEYK